VKMNWIVSQASPVDLLSHTDDHPVIRFYELLPWKLAKLDLTISARAPEHARQQSSSNYYHRPGLCRPWRNGTLAIRYAIEIEPEAGIIWVCRISEDTILAFTDFGIESLIERIKIHKKRSIDPETLNSATLMAAAYSG